MWILDANGDFLDGKTIWLRPGSKHLLGRLQTATKEEENGFVCHKIIDKSVSRKHAQITVDPLSEGSGLGSGKRSTVKIEDASTIGTFLDDKKIGKGKTVDLSGTQHELKLGNWSQIFTIKWIPISLALTHLSRKNTGTGMKEAQAQLEAFDIKMTSAFEPSQTTHAVAAKRNTPAVLEALVLGVYIVTSDYLHEIAEACCPEPGSIRSPLEKDFYSAWPDPANSVPPPSMEPVQRPASMMAPNPDRRNIFSGFLFVFCTQPQLNSLQGVISSGGGKSMLFTPFEEGVTPPENLVNFIKSRSAQTKLKTNVVRIQANDPLAEWKTNLITKTDELLGLRTIVQNEFLDVILTGNQGSLHQPILSTTALSSTVVASINGGISKESLPSPSPSEHEIKKDPPSQFSSTASKRLRYARATSRFKGFDDFTEASIPSIPATAEEEEEEHAVHETKIIAEQEDPLPKGTKRDASFILEKLLPAASTIKRRKLGKEARSTPLGSDKEDGEPQIKTAEEVKPKKLLFRKFTVHRNNVQPDEFTGSAELEEAAQYADIRAAATQEEIDASGILSAEELEQVRNGIQYDVMPMRQAPVHQALASREANGWDPAWKGRKNFKSFRRNGGDTTTEGELPLRGGRSTVRLEEAPRKPLVMGAVRWAASGGGSIGSSSGRNHNTFRLDEEDDNNEEANNSGEDILQFRSQNATLSKRANATCSGNLDELIPVEDLPDEYFPDNDASNLNGDFGDIPSGKGSKAGRRQPQESLRSSGNGLIQVPSSDRPSATASATISGASMGGLSANSALQSSLPGRKRPAPGRTGESPAAKRGGRTSRLRREQVEVEADEDDDSEEELRFRGGRRTRR